MVLNAETVASPSIVITKEPITCALIAPVAQIIRPS